MIPKFIDAVEIAQPGGTEVLRRVQRPCPQPAPGEILIKVAAAGVNRADIVQRQGFYPPPAGASDLPGLEVSGHVAALGADVKNWQLGDRVCALLSGGGYASYAVAAASECLPVPDGMDLIEAATLPEAILTVWSNLMQRAALRPGEVVLIHGGSSGIGSAAIQLCKLYGCQVLSTVGSPEKAQFASKLGADLAINYRVEDFVERVLAATSGRGADVILDMVGGDYVQRNISAAAADGRIVNIAFLQGSKVAINLLPVMLKRLTLTGSTLRSRTPAFKAGLVSEVRHRAWPWIEQGRYQTVLFHRFDLGQAGEAHQLMESSSHMGKLVLVPTC